MKGHKVYFYGKMWKLSLNYSHYLFLSGGAKVLGKLPGIVLIWIRVGQGPTALGVLWMGCLDILSLIYHFSFLSPSLWETARYRLKQCLKGLLSPKQSTNQPIFLVWRTAVCISHEDTNQPVHLHSLVSSFHSKILKLGHEEFIEQQQRLIRLHK